MMPDLLSDDERQAFIDGRLPLERRAAIEARLTNDPEAAREVARDIELRDALRTALASKLAEPVPDRLRLANLRAQRMAQKTHALARRRWPAAAQRLAAAFLLVALGGAGGWWLRGPDPSVGSVTAQEVTADAVAAFRTFSVEVAHPVEVGASEEAHLVAWLSRRLDRPLDPPDLAAFGYRLVGGRLLPAGPSVAAQLMYEDGAGERLTVYVRAGSTGETAFRFHNEGGVSTFAWLDQDFGFAVSAAADRAHLLPVAEAIYRAFG